METKPGVPQDQQQVRSIVHRRTGKYVFAFMDPGYDPLLRFRVPQVFQVPDKPVPEGLVIPGVDPPSPGFFAVRIVMPLLDGVRQYAVVCFQSRFAN